MSDQPKRKVAQAPISAHPAFPAIVALWFAALLGLGSLVLPVGLYERASEASGLSSLVAAARPPLGVTARILVALVAGGLGVFAGLAIAHRVIAASWRDPAPRRAAQPKDSAAKRPISAHDELGAGGLDAEAGEGPRRDPLPARCRARSVTDDSPRSEFLDHAPLPGHDPHRETPPEAEPEPLDLAGFDTMAAGQDEPAADASSPRFAHFGRAVPSDPPVPGTAFVAPARCTGSLRQDSPPGKIALGETMVLAPPPGMGPGPTAEAPAGPGQSLAGLGMVELVERFARALQRHRESVRIDEEAGREAAAIEPVVIFPGQSPRRGAPAVDADVGTPVSFSTPPPRPFDDPANRLAAAASTLPVAPSASPADSTETEKRLREALEKLQKMSGVG